jgi:thiol:disulfide interchange protein
MFNPVFHRTSTHLAGLVVLLLMVGAIPTLVASEEIRWRETVEDTMTEAAKTGKPIMMDFYTDW